MANFEKLQRIDIDSLGGKVKIQSTITNKNGFMPEEGQVIGSFKSAEKAKSAILRHRIGLAGVLIADGMLGAGAVITGIISFMDNAARATSADPHNDLAKVAASAAVVSLSYFSGKEVTKSIKQLNNVQTALKDATKRSAFPYRKVFSIEQAEEPQQ